MSDQRCTLCHELGHKRTAHDPYASSGTRRKDPPGWYVAVFDIAGPMDAWYGPLHWSVACALARLLETRIRRARIVVGRRTAAMHGEPTPLPDGWQDYEPTRIQRTRRLQPCTRGRRAA